MGAPLKPREIFGALYELQNETLQPIIFSIGILKWSLRHYFYFKKISRSLWRAFGWIHVYNCIIMSSSSWSHNIQPLDRTAIKCIAVRRIFLSLDNVLQSNTWLIWAWKITWILLKQKKTESIFIYIQTI